MTGQGPGFVGEDTSLVDQKRKQGRESDRPGQAFARQNPKFVGHLTDDWLLFAGLLLHLAVTKNTTVERVGQKKPSMLTESSNVFQNFQRCNDCYGKTTLSKALNRLRPSADLAYIPTRGREICPRIQNFSNFWPLQKSLKCGYFWVLLCLYNYQDFISLA